jgi:hypothetical protein
LASIHLPLIYRGSEKLARRNILGVESFWGRNLERVVLGALPALCALRTLHTNECRVCAMADRDDLDETVSVRFPAKVRARLEQLAAADDRRVSQVVRRIVTRALENNQEGQAA